MRSLHKMLSLLGTPGPDSRPPSVRTIATRGDLVCASVTRASYGRGGHPVFTLRPESVFAPRPECVFARSPAPVFASADLGTE